MISHSTKNKKVWLDLSIPSRMECWTQLNEVQSHTKIGQKKSSETRVSVSVFGHAKADVYHDQLDPRA